MKPPLCDLGLPACKSQASWRKDCGGPSCASDLRISEQTVAGETSYVIKIHETNSYNRYGRTEYELLQLCDGTRTYTEIAEELTNRHPESPLDETEVLEFIDSIEPAMWERSIGEKNLAVLERIRDERKGRVDQSSMLYISFKAWDPNKTLAKMDQYLSWMFTWGSCISRWFIFAVSSICWREIGRGCSRTRASSTISK